MTLSVIVTSYDAGDRLKACLASIAAQPVVSEIIVADCSRVDPTDEVRAMFPQARVLHFAEKTTLPVLRWAAARIAAGDVIAATEARCVPTHRWCAELIDAHRIATDTPAIGGPVELKPNASAFDWGLFFSEFGAFAPPLPDRDVRQLSGANLSYKKTALEESRDLLDEGAWETLLHERWVREGRRLRIRAGARIVFHNGMHRTDALRMRFQYGRSYAAARFPADRWLVRFTYAAGSLLLPIVLTWRNVRAAIARRRATELRRALHWVALFNVLWAAGELTGYLAGPPPRPEIF
jgi:hypothetical protein